MRKKILIIGASLALAVPAFVLADKNNSDVEDNNIIQEDKVYEPSYEENNRDFELDERDYDHNGPMYREENEQNQALDSKKDKSESKKETDTDTDKDNRDQWTYDRGESYESYGDRPCHERGGRMGRGHHRGMMGGQYDSNNGYKYDENYDGNRRGHGHRWRNGDREGNYGPGQHHRGGMMHNQEWK